MSDVCFRGFFMEDIFREYKKSDYVQCEELVSQAWGFDYIFSSESLSTFAKYLYTKGAVMSSNYKMVVENQGQVVGFFYGFNERAKKPAKNLLFRLYLFIRLMSIKGSSLEKKTLLEALSNHQKNRLTVVENGKNEIVLFVVSKDYQRKGIGKKLWFGFKEYCIEYGVKSVIVETNKLGASRFYEKVGFKHLSDFDSPLHEFATKNGQACIYEYLC